MKKSKCSVIIAAAGEGKRLQPLTLDFNKPLFEFRSKPIIAHLIDRYKEFSDDIVIAVSEDDKGRFLKAWLLDYYDDPEWLRINFLPPPHLGTNRLVMDCLRLTKHQRTLISWADFVIEEDIKPFLQDQNVFFTANTTCRFSEKNGCVVRETSNPGFCGLYFLTRKPNIGWFQEDFLENYIKHPVKTQLIKITNLGTIPELITHQAFNKTSNRYFNQLEFTDTQVIKTALDDHGKKLQKLEANWYDHISDELKPYVPKHQYNRETNQLTLERLEDAKPISEIPSHQLGTEFWRKKLPELLIKLHTPAPIPVDIQSCVDTYINKPRERLVQVERTIDAWFEGGPRIVNGEDYTDCQMEIPCPLFPTAFTFGHGDLQFSNMMMNRVGDLFMVDSRGYFGMSELYLDPTYDIAKLIYGAIDNYHKINEGDFLIGKTGKGTILVHQSNPITNDIKWFIDWAIERYDVSKEKLNYLLWSIWLSLTGYLKNSPRGIIGSYCMSLIRSKHCLIK